MEKPLIIIKPVSRFSLNFRELWQYRELFYFFTWRDIKVKFKQTYLGVLWVVLQPLVLMLLLSFIFSSTFRQNTGQIPYPVFILSGLLLWNLFSSSLSHASESIVQHAAIIRKIYFPRIIIPGSAALVALFDFMISLIIFFLICLVYKNAAGWDAFWLIPASVLITLTAAVGLGALLAALNVKYRDFRYMLPFLLQVLFFATQVLYPLKTIQQDWLRYLLAANPVNGSIELLRASFTNDTPDQNIVIISVLSSVIFFVIGIFYFRKTESYFADLV